MKGHEQHCDCHAELNSKGLANAKHWDVIVDVYLHSETPGDFEIESYLKDPGTHRLIFWNSHRSGFWVTFNLIDETGLNYCFPDHPHESDAIWSVYTDDPQFCPSRGQWDVFGNDGEHRISVKDKGKTLIAFNPNDRIGLFRYTLNVTKNNGASYLALDPGGNNQNGNVKAR